MFLNFSNMFTGKFLEREQQSSSTLLLQNLMRQWDERILSLKFWKLYFLASFLPSAELRSGFERRLFGKAWCFRQVWLKCRWVLCLTMQRLVLMWLLTSRTKAEPNDSLISLNIFLLRRRQYFDKLKQITLTKETLTNYLWMIAHWEILKQVHEVGNSLLM